MQKQSTIEKVEAVSNGVPEYVDSKGLRAIFGISRSLGYDLINDGNIKSVCLRKRGASTGKRLWVADSVREYLNSQVDERDEAQQGDASKSQTTGTINDGGLL